MMTGGIEAYRRVSVQTMDRGRLLLAMYEGGISFLKQAVAAHGEKDLEAFSRSLRRGQDIVSELMSTLDYEPAPRLAAMLEGIYDFMLFELSEANLLREVQRVEHVIRLLARIYDAYRRVITSPSPDVQAILAALPAIRR